MRSRFSAFVVGDAAYLRRTWHPRTRPAHLDLDDGLHWTRLEILSASGGPFDDHGHVEFRAHYVRDGDAAALHERSRFVREAAHWLYLDGDVH